MLSHLLHVSSRVVLKNNEGSDIHVQLVAQGQLGRELTIPFIK